ncbi:MAG: ribosome biogenesis GTPase YlqF [Clostridia bacterium]|nr:ribosome biogenesis GTPase YlqF [Clostridia bacterium]
MLIQWYPGHMAKARRMLTENLKLIDVVVELVDARAPLATRNPDFDELFGGKERVILLNKSDLAEAEKTKAWIAYYRAQHITAMEIVSTNAGKKKEAVALIERAAAPVVERYRKKGVTKTVRAMIVGIPNVGKSTFINRLAGSNRAQVGDRPGVTKGKQWVKVSDYLEVMDTPGLLWPKLEDETLARHLAYIGSIKDDIMDVEQLAALLLYDLMRIVPEAVSARYKACEPGMMPETLLNAVCESRGFILPGHELDTERAARAVLDEYRGCKIARVSLETPDEAK